MWAAAIAFSSTAAAAAQPPRAVHPALVAVEGRAVARGRRKVPLVPGRFNEEQQAAHAAARAANARVSGGHDAGGVRETLGHKYWCDVCSRGFDRAKQQAEHEAGKRHLAAVEASEGYWLEYRASAWFEPAETDEERLRTVVTGAWSLDAFVVGLPRRSRSRGSSSRPSQVSPRVIIYERSDRAQSLRSARRPHVVITPWAGPRCSAAARATGSSTRT